MPLPESEQPPELRGLTPQQLQKRFKESLPISVHQKIQESNSIRNAAWWVFWGYNVGTYAVEAKDTIEDFAVDVGVGIGKEGYDAAAGLGTLVWDGAHVINPPLGIVTGVNPNDVFEKYVNSAIHLLDKIITGQFVIDIYEEFVENPGEFIGRRIFDVALGLGVSKLRGGAIAKAEVPGSPNAKTPHPPSTLSRPKPKSPPPAAPEPPPGVETPKRKKGKRVDDPDYRSAIERHHNLPKDFKKQFERAGLNIEDF